MRILTKFLFFVFCKKIQGDFDTSPLRWSMSFDPRKTIGKRTDGYNPIAGYCGIGDSCLESCGKNFIACDSEDSTLHCFNPTQGQICCPNGSGYACDEGFYCTQDVTDRTFCCPNGVDLATCAGLYSAVSLETAHSTKTISTTSTVLTTRTITAVDTVVVTINAVSNIVVTESILATSTSTISGNVTSTSSIINATYIEYNPTSNGAKLGSLGKTIVLSIVFVLGSEVFLLI